MRLKEMAEEEGDDAAGALKKIREMVGDVSFGMYTDECIQMNLHMYMIVCMSGHK